MSACLGCRGCHALLRGCQQASTCLQLLAAAACPCRYSQGRRCGSPACAAQAILGWQYGGHGPWAERGVPWIRLGWQLRLQGAGRSCAAAAAAAAAWRGGSPPTRSMTTCATQRKGR